jgi:hypothetical protein
MTAPTILREDWESDPRLREVFGVTRKELWPVHFAAVAARASFQPHHPANAAGLLSYIFGTGALRDVFCGKKDAGWEVNRSKNIESVYHPASKTKIIFQNVDTACGINIPRPISSKGPANAEAVNGQGELFPDLAHGEANLWVWYFCVGADDTAELLRPEAIADGQFKGHHERVWIVKPGEWADVDTKSFGTADAAADFDVEITRKDTK